MHLLSSLLFALSANIDNFTVGIAYGIKKIKIPFFSNLLIAFITAAGTCISMAIGIAVSKILTPSSANILGSVILILLGVWIAKDYFKYGKAAQDDQPEKTHKPHYDQILSEPEKADRDHSGTIDSKESLTLALALMVNNFGLGIGASITGLNIAVTALCTFFFSILSILIGCLLGKRCFSTFFGRFAPLLSGLIVIVLGVYELLV